MALGRWSMLTPDHDAEGPSAQARAAAMILSSGIQVISEAQRGVQSYMVTQGVKTMAPHANAFFFFHLFLRNCIRYQVVLSSACGICQVKPLFIEMKFNPWLMLQHLGNTFLKFLMPEAGLEPAWSRAPGDFESPASANFTTPANLML